MKSNLIKIEAAVESVRKKRSMIRFVGVGVTVAGILCLLIVMGIFILPSLDGVPKLVFRLIFLAGILGSFGWAAYILIKSSETTEQAARAKSMFSTHPPIQDRINRLLSLTT